MGNILTKELLLKSVEEWNAARKAYPDLKPDLSDADFNMAVLREADLSHADLANATFVEADLRGADLRGANLFGVCLKEAILSYADISGADLAMADLRDSDLGEADLSLVIFRDTNLSGTYFSGANVGLTTFVNVDLSSAIGLDTIKHNGPSTIGIDSIYRSNGNIPEVFLRGCGVPDIFIEYVPSLTVMAIDFSSCFISYSTKDDDFASRIHKNLQASGVRCWFAPHDIQGGKKVLHQIEEAIRKYDKLLLILSPDSMNSNWVKEEIINAIQKEQQQRKQVLFPIGIVPFDEIKKWKCFDSDSGRDLAREIREYHIPDFSLWESNPTAYKTAFDRLLKDLKQ